MRKKKNERAQKEAIINLNRKIEAIVSEAEEMMPSSVGKTKTERLADIRENRKEEKEAIRAEEAFTSEGNDRNGHKGSGSPEPG